MTPVPDMGGWRLRGTIRYRHGAWRLRVDGGKDPVTGKRRQIERTLHAPDSQKGRRLAETELAKLIAEVEARRTAPRVGLTVAQVLDRWILARAPDWSPGQGEATRRRADHHITPYIGDVPVEKLRPIDVQSLIDRWRAKGMAPGTVRRTFTVLHAALAWAERYQVIPDNPAARVEKPDPGRKHVSPPAPSDVARLISAAADDPELAMFVRLAALTGARRGQLVALRWGDINFDLDPVTVRWTRSLAIVPGGTQEKGTKTGARWQIALDPYTVDALRTLRRRAAERALAAGASLASDAYVFARDSAGEVPWHPDGATQRFKRLCRQVGVEGVRLHDLRHWMATQGLGDDTDIKTVAARGGWANTTTPLEVYSAFVPARDADLALRLAKLLDGESSLGEDLDSEPAENPG
jgi:integrase